MESALEPIKFYFEEGKRLWDKDPERVIHKDFFELWENIQQPRPFRYSGNEIKLFDSTFELAGDSPERIAYFLWDNEEESAALIIEGANCEDKFLLTFDGGEPRVYETEPRYFEKVELEYGERLEIIYDVIAYVKKHQQHRNVLEMTKNEFVQALEGLSDRYPKFAINVMKRLSAVFIKSLIKKAADDMAADELSAQLSLPLDGSYATAFEQESTPRINDKPQRFVIEPRTPWTAINELELLKMACRFAADAEKTFVLSLQEAEVLEEQSSGPDLMLKVPAEPQMPVREGELLNICRFDTDEEIGTFKVDIFDGNLIYGRLRLYDGVDYYPLRQQIFARLRRSPSEFIARAMEELLKLFRENAIRPTSVLNYMLGMKRCHYTSQIADNAPGHMDMSQKRAWSSAVDGANPLVLIQGPPGTGKTSVLEHILREACKQGKRILVTAPSNTAVDNICRRVMDLPVLRFGNVKESISPDVCNACWYKIKENVITFTERRRDCRGGGIYCGTHVGLIKNSLIMQDVAQNGIYDLIIFDEAGMSHFQEFLLCANLGERAVIIGDHQQLPPFPMPEEVFARLKADYGTISRNLWTILKLSALEWLVETRNFPIIMLQESYRCQNPRLLRFCSTLFYDAGVKTSQKAEYYQLSYHERQKKYPAATLRLFSTSKLPLPQKRETIVFQGGVPGILNYLEAETCVMIFYEMLKKYPLHEITIISPYKKQVRLIRQMLCFEQAGELCSHGPLTEKDWDLFLFSRLATVDSFQGGESDVVIISYVRSNRGTGIGFVDDPNRINVTHTRCRREMVVVADIDCLKQQAKNAIFERMERAIERDGVVVEVEPAAVKRAVRQSLAQETESVA